MCPVVHKRHIVRAQRLIRHGQIPVRAGLGTPIVHLLADGQLLLVILDGRLVEPGRRVRVSDVPVRPPHPGAVLQVARDRQVRLVQLERGVVLAEQLVDDAEVGAGPALRHLVAHGERHVELALVPVLGLGVVAGAAGRVAQAGVRSRLHGPKDRTKITDGGAINPLSGTIVGFLIDPH